MLPAFFEFIIIIIFRGIKRRPAAANQKKEGYKKKIVSWGPTHGFLPFYISLFYL